MKHALIAMLVAAPVIAARGQGNLSTQGYGYPQGQLTTRALSLGGAVAEIDATSGLNPGALGMIPTRTVLFQLEPEFRTLTGAAGSDRTTTARYPLVSIAAPFGPKYVFGISASSLLDRSWATSTTRTETIGTEQIETTLNESSNGAINDLRLGGAWTNHASLSIGIGLHAITGRNTVISSESFSDSAFDAFTSTRRLSYSGSAVSIGAQLTGKEQHFTLGLSYRKGGSLRAKSNDTTIAQGNVPDRFGVSVAYTGIAGTVLAARASHDGWSSMTSMLATAGEEAHDGWDLGGGGEFPGPRFMGRTFPIRLGVRSRSLPFEAAEKLVTEKSASLGSGMAFGGGRVVADFALTRQWRDADIFPSVKERAWTLSISLTARP
jgi:hypothetical protein